MLGGAELSRKPLLRFGGPCGPGVSRPADFRTNRLVSPSLACLSRGAWEMLTTGSTLSAEWLPESLGSSVQRTSARFQLQHLSHLFVIQSSGGLVKQLAT